MSQIDDFAASLLEEAKRFFEKADDADRVQNIVALNANLHAALMLAFSALEAHTNAIADEFSDRPELSVHEIALLQEKEVRLDNGVFKLAGLRMVRLEDRILFLHQRFAGRELDRNAQWWADLMSAVKLRNRLTHPKSVPEIELDAVRRAITAIISVVDVLFRAIYKRPFPVAGLGLQSKLSF